MSLGKFKLLISVVGVALGCTAGAQSLTGTLGVNELAPQNGSFTASSLTLNPTNLIMTASGNLGTLVSPMSDLEAYALTINGLSSTPLAVPINGYFSFSTTDSNFGGAGTTPPDRYEFNLATLTEVAYNSPNNANFTGTGMLVDTLGTYSSAPATFNLSFSGPNNYSFSLIAVPEPSTFALLLTGLGAIAFRYGKKYTGKNS